MMEMRVYFKGKVQGVFFRASVKKHAKILGINGFVKNLADGSVELRAVAEKELLESFLKKIEKDHGHAQITSKEVHYFPGFTKYNDFSIR